MGFIPRRRIKENLKDVQVFINDTQNEYIKIQDIPDTFVQGRSAFKIFGSSFLKESVPLKIEILDKAGNTVWTQPVIYGQTTKNKLPYRYISVEVYPPPFNIPGDAELVILGELEETEVPFTIPQEFIGTYNVKYRRTLNIDTATVINTQPILFYKKPTVSAQEIVKAQKKTSAPTNAYISGSQLYGNVNTILYGTHFPTRSAVNSQTNTDEDEVDDIRKDIDQWKYKTGMYQSRAVLSKRGIPEEKMSQHPPQMTLYSKETGKFNTKMIGGDITVRNIDIPLGEKYSLSGAALGMTGTFVDTLVTNAFGFPDFKAKVESVASDTELTVTRPYAIEFTPFDESPNEKIYSNIGSAASSLYANFTSSYVDWEVPSTSSYRYDSFIDLNITNMRTFSGDVWRLRVYGASDSSQGDFPVLLETVIESPQLLKDTTSPSGFLRSGYFIDQTHIDKYWNTYGGDNETSTLNPYYTMSLADGMHLSGSYINYNQVGRAELNSTYTFTVKRDIPYTLSFKAKGRKSAKYDTIVNQDSGTSADQGKLFFHLKGTNLSTDDRLGIQYSASFGQTIQNEHGQKVGIQMDESDPSNVWKDFGILSHTFIPKFKLNTVANTDTNFQIRIHSGEWILSNISLRPATDTGFSPDEFKMVIPLKL